MTAGAAGILVQVGGPGLRAGEQEAMALPRSCRKADTVNSWPSATKVWRVVEVGLVS